MKLLDLKIKIYLVILQQTKLQIYLNIIQSLMKHLSLILIKLKCIEIYKI